MSELEGTAKVIFDEVMDEIDEELEEALVGIINKEKLEGIIKQVQEEATSDVTGIINKYYSDNMSAVKKLILGERIARVVTGNVKVKLQDLVSEILKQSLDVVDELRNEIIGEVFEETEDD